MRAGMCAIDDAGVCNSVPCPGGDREIWLSCALTVLDTSTGGAGGTCLDGARFLAASSSALNR